jgi:hypothetical protein
MASFKSVVKERNPRRPIITFTVNQPNNNLSGGTHDQYLRGLRKDEDTNTTLFLALPRKER